MQSVSRHHSNHVVMCFTACRSDSLVFVDEWTESGSSCMNRDTFKQQFCTEATGWTLNAAASRSTLPLATKTLPTNVSRCSVSLIYTLFMTRLFLIEGRLTLIKNTWDLKALANKILSISNRSSSARDEFLLQQRVITSAARRVTSWCAELLESFSP